MFSSFYSLETLFSFKLLSKNFILLSLLKLLFKVYKVYSVSEIFVSLNFNKVLKLVKHLFKFNKPLGTCLFAWGVMISIWWPTLGFISFGSNPLGIRFNWKQECFNFLILMYSSSFKINIQSFNIPEWFVRGNVGMFCYLFCFSFENNYLVMYFSVITS